MEQEAVAEAAITLGELPAEPGFCKARVGAKHRHSHKCIHTTTISPHHPGIHTGRALEQHLGCCATAAGQQHGHNYSKAVGTSQNCKQPESYACLCAVGKEKVALCPFAIWRHNGHLSKAERFSEQSGNISITASFQHMQEPQVTG